MSKAKAMVEQVAFRELAAVIEGATVYQDAPANAAGDLVIIGDLKSARLPGKESSDDRRVGLQIVSIAIAEERAPLLALMDQIEETLDGQSFELEGWTIVFGFEDDDAVLNEDGASYSGISSFTALALAP